MSIEEHETSEQLTCYSNGRTGQVRSTKTGKTMLWIADCVLNLCNIKIPILGPTVSTECTQKWWSLTTFLKLYALSYLLMEWQWNIYGSGVSCLTNLWKRRVIYYPPLLTRTKYSFWHVLNWLFSITIYLEWKDKAKCKIQFRKNK